MPNPINLIDIHSHLNFPHFENDLEKIVDDLRKEKIKCINIGCDEVSSLKSIELSNKYPDLFRSIVGLHPLYVEKENSDWIENMLSEKYVVGIGECGLDNTRNIDMDLQYRYFNAQIQLAIKHDLPIMMHIRNMYKESLSMLDEYLMSNSVKLKMNAHFFNGTIEEAKSFLNRGAYISLTGIITFVNLDDLIRFLPIDRIMIETDAPYAAPHPYRGQQNSPLYVGFIAEKIAKIKNIDIEVCKDLLVKNSISFFNLDF